MQHDKRTGDGTKTELIDGAYRFEAAALLLGLVAGLLLLHQLGHTIEEDFEKAALGQATDPERPRVGGHFVHCGGFALATDKPPDLFPHALPDCIAGARERRASATVLWLGNSQVHAVNQHKPGEGTAAGPLHARLRGHGLDAITVSYPNANQLEHLATYAYVKAHLPLRAVVLSLVFDDFREDGVRARLQPAVADANATKSLRSSAIGRDLIAGVEDRSTGNGPAGNDATLQSRSEKTLTTWLADHSAFWASRPQVRGRIFMFLYRLRNSLFGITPQTVRRMIPGRYAANRAAVAAMLADAKASGIAVLGYIAPLRSDVTPPYAPTEYANFIADMRQLFDTSGAALRNLEHLVPAELWGTKNSTGVAADQEVDFMHFQAGGHALVADALSEYVHSVGIVP